MKYPRHFLSALIMAAACSSPMSPAADSVSAGTFTNQGRALVAEPANPASASYRHQVQDLIGRQWYALVKDRRADFAGKLVKIHFAIAPAGKVAALKVTRSNDDPFVELCKQAILACHFPPFPPELLREEKADHFEMDLQFTVY